MSSNDNTRLPVSRNSYNASTSSNISNLPQFSSSHRASRAGSNMFRLSQTTTNNTESVYPSNEYDNQSVKTIDNVPSVKPSVTYSDKLWTQIDVLDDVKHMSDQVHLKGSFFNDKFNQELTKLKESQNKLLEVMANQHSTNTGNSEQQKMLNTLNTLGPHPGDAQVSEQPQSVSEERKQKKFNEFFGESARDSKNSVYPKQNFDEISHYVDQIRENLNAVGESMKKFDDTTRELW